MVPRKCTIRFGTSITPNFAKLLDVVPPTDTDYTISTLIANKRLPEKTDLAKLRRPSLSAILSAISDQKGLYLWQKAKIEEMGASAFKSYMTDRMTLGTRTHTKVEEMLNIGHDEAELIQIIDNEKSVPIRNYMKSALPVILKIQDPKTSVSEQKVRHPMLAYQGRFDAVVKYNENWCILDWKTAPARSTFSQQGEDSISYATYVRQLAAYASAYNYDIRFDGLPIAKQGLLVSLKEDGAPAEIYEISEKDMEKTLEDLKIKLKEFWNKVMTSKHTNIDFAYKPVN